MAADVVLNGDTLELHGNVVALDNEIATTGKLAGFSFVDRADPTKRYVLYANAGSVRLYLQGVGDLFQITNKGQKLLLEGLALQVKQDTQFKEVKTESLKILVTQIVPSSGTTSGSPTGKNSDGGKIQGLPDKSITQPIFNQGGITNQGGIIGKLNPPTIVQTEYDLLDKISQLEARLSQLEQKVTASTK
jgi:hypothetical protein